MSKQKGKVWYYLSSGSGKWERVKPVSDTSVEEWVARFERHGVPVKQGGKNNAEAK